MRELEIAKRLQFVLNKCHDDLQHVLQVKIFTVKQYIMQSVTDTVINIR